MPIDNEWKVIPPSVSRYGGESNVDENTVESLWWKDLWKIVRGERKANGKSLYFVRKCAGLEFLVEKLLKAFLCHFLQ